MCKKKSFSILLLFVMIALALAASRIINAEDESHGYVVQHSDPEGDSTVYFSIHNSINYGLALSHKQKSIQNDRNGMEKNSDSQLLAQPQPNVIQVNPDIAWWNDVIQLSGENFSTMKLENVVHFQPVRTHSEPNPTANSMSVKIPKAARTSFPIVTNSGIYGLSQMRLNIVAPSNPANFPGIISVVEGRNNHYIYVATNEYLVPFQPTTLRVENLYSDDQPITITIIDSNVTIRPFLTRMTGGAEICYIKNNPLDNNLPDIYCFTDGSTDLLVRGHVHNSDGSSVPIDVRALDAMGYTYFYLANALTGHVIRVEYGGYVENQDFGGLGATVLNFFSPRTAPGAYWIVYGYTAISVTSIGPQSDCASGYTCLHYLSPAGYSLDGAFPFPIYDLEVDRRVSTSTAIRMYLFEGTIASTLAEDTIHDFRGFVDAFDANADGTYERLMLNVNTTTYIESIPYTQDPWAAANQHPVVISTYLSESIQNTLGYPVSIPGLGQDKPLFIKIHFRCWPNRYCYLRIIDPLDYIGYAAGYDLAQEQDCVTESDSGIARQFRFQQIWFKNRNTEPPDWQNSPSNYWHKIGAFRCKNYKTNAPYTGFSKHEANASFVFYKSIVDDCKFNGRNPPPGNCNSVELTNYVQYATDHEMMHLFGYASDEYEVDYAWCGKYQGAYYGCPHPDGEPPNSGYLDQWCIMSPILKSEHDQTIAMRTGGVNRLDCILLGKYYPCYFEQFPRPGIRRQLDPQ